MSFVAYCEEEHINLKRAQDIQPNEQDNIFYCQNPRCNCKFTVSAFNSTKVRTHFVKLPSSNHITGCWNDVTLSESGNKNDYDTSDFSPLSLLNNIQKAPDRKTSIVEKNSSYFGSYTKVKETLYIHTVRQLYSICMMNADTEEINGTKIKNIFAGRKTSYLYTKYISGIKLVECTYHRYNSQRLIIEFYFPCNTNNFVVTIHFNSMKLFQKINHQLYNYKHPVLIYAEWNNKWAEITSSKQIVPLK